MISRQMCETETECTHARQETVCSISCCMKLSHYGSLLWLSEQVLASLKYTFKYKLTSYMLAYSDMQVVWCNNEID